MKKARKLITEDITDCTKELKFTHSVKRAMKEQKGEFLKVYASTDRRVVYLVESVVVW